MKELAIFTDVGKKLFHVYLKTKDDHKYYGSLKAIFDDKNDVGVSKFTLDRYDFSKPFENEKVIIRKGEMLSTGDVKK
ncbi:MAG TPA: hypothetical protein VF622_17915 [Segetibacter sp.]|jgi:hypothetical protein